MLRFAANANRVRFTSSSSVARSQRDVRSGLIVMRIVAFIFGQFWLLTAWLLYVAGYLPSSFAYKVHWDGSSYSIAWTAAVGAAAASFIVAGLLSCHEQHDSREEG